MGNPLAERAWGVFESYMKSANEHDLPTLRTLSHQISDTCNNPEMETDCFLLMDSVYVFGSNFKKEDFTNVWFDDNQIILASDYKQVDDEQANVRGLTRSVLYFTRNGSGEPKLLKFNDVDGVFIQKMELDEDTINSRLAEMVKDSDEDGLPDEMEECLETSFFASGCKATNPNVRDTDGDGWWDGIEIFFYFQN